MSQTSTRVTQTQMHTNAQPTLISSTTSSLNPPDLNPPPPITNHLPSPAARKRIPSRADALRRGSPPTHHRHPDVVEPTPKFHHPRKPPRDRRDRPHLMSHHPLISRSPGRGSERRPSARTRGLSQTKVDRRRSFRWPVCATGASTRRFGSHFVCGRSGVRCRRRDCGARRDRGGSCWVGVGWWVFGVGGGW